VDVRRLNEAFGVPVVVDNRGGAGGTIGTDLTAKATMWEVTRINIYIIGVLLAVLIMVTYVPVTGLGLVNLFYR
jgi:tripartite-type tricarboxylate transporter receptor subunit TctC